MTFPPAEPPKAGRRPASAHAFSTNVPRLTFLVPGFAQWSQGRRTRGLILAGLYLISAASALLLWGNPTTWLFLVGLVFIQALSWVEGVRQNPFSGLTPTPVLAVMGGGLSLALHAPIFGLLTLLAWPSYGPDPGGGSYLVNRLAYKDHLPSPGQWVWLDGSTTGLQSAAKVVAVGGQEVEWTGRRWLVNGEEVVLDPGHASAGYPKRWKFRVPSGHVLIDPGSGGARSDETRAALIMVPREHIVGQVWAHCSPFWERGLL
ncbi:hypothetical protein [Paludisphaera mucosa]|uniref:Peptidase S26 domain-containing protein n=1 Tax=Paludisphaera mucosa TaxID=3030827 RepID=A0ABT6F693_9BACT|nr:hypothetical protein [Paludisphaera mucosa]MDG3003096.1 hypothetical protein [Paludisphaera mucosa]